MKDNTKKKIINIVIICILCLIVLVCFIACEPPEQKTIKYNNTDVIIEPIKFHLYYDELTNIVYYRCKVGADYYMYYPYLSENGKILKYEDQYYLKEIDN